ncbi:MAG TPA: helix-turn-helix domain-containing protein [Steroidobacter sp.]|uniref:helix-turn-helix domain-containing protein n=1 Tax=Steroidobacter sp. TaxID=1978227 RepID=UPI002ED9BF9A
MDQQIVDIEQLAPGRLDGSDSSVAFDSVLTCRIGSNLPALIRVRGLRGSACFVLSNTAESIYCSGVHCGPEHCLVTGDADLTLICRAPAEAILCRIDARAATASHAPRGTYRLAGNADALSRIRAMISSLHDPLDKCATLPSALLSHNATCLELRDSLTGLSLVSHPSESSSSNHRALCVERGRQYIHANLGGALRIASVCEAAGIRSRTLEYGFRELFGVSPVSYIKALRLNRVRRLLCSSAAARRTITAIALDTGFWHLSQFAADYQKFFGESPSITRRRALSETSLQPREARSASGF